MVIAVTLHVSGNKFLGFFRFIGSGYKLFRNKNSAREDTEVSNAPQDRLLPLHCHEIDLIVLVYETKTPIFV